MAFDLTLSTSPAAAFTNGKYGLALTSGFGTLPANAGLFPTGGAFTYECWAQGATSGIQVATGQSNVAWLGANGGIATCRYGQGGTEVALSGPDISSAGYHHLALVLSASGGAFYVDGILASSSAATAATAGVSYTSNAFEVRTFLGGNFGWTGGVDEVAVSSAAKYTANFTPAAIATTQPGLIALYRFENDGTNSLGAALPAVPATPTGVTATGAPGQNTIAWTASAGATSYNILRSLTPGGTFAVVGTSPASPYADTSAVPGTPYYYQVTAANGGGISAPSATAGPATTTTSASAVTQAPNDPSIVYSGSWLVSAITAKTINSGQCFRTIVPAGTITLNFDLTGVVAPVPQITVLLNGELVLRASIAATVAVPIPAGIGTEAYHLLEIITASATETVSRWAPQATAVAFTGFTLGGTGSLRKPGTRPFKVQFFGDSITEGTRTLYNAGSGSQPDANTASKGWAWAMRDYLGAEVDIIGFGGSGLTVTGSGGIPPLPTSCNQLWSGQARSFAAPADLIILMEGTNDGAANTTSAYTAALNTLLAATPATTKILALRPFNGTTQATFIQNAIAACTTPARVTYGDTAGFWQSADSSDGLHPYGFSDMALIAPAVAALAKPLLLGTATAPAIPTGNLPVGLSLFKFVSPTADNIANYLGLGIIWTVPDAGSWVSGKPVGPSFQAVTQFLPGRKYYVLNTSTAPISLYGAQL